jgi:hypothetical protein
VYPRSVTARTIASARPRPEKDEKDMGFLKLYRPVAARATPVLKQTDIRMETRSEPCTRRLAANTK